MMRRLQNYQNRMEESLNEVRHNGAEQQPVDSSFTGGNDTNNDTINSPE